MIKIKSILLLTLISCTTLSATDKTTNISPIADTQEITTAQKKVSPLSKTKKQQEYKPNWAVYSAVFFGTTVVLGWIWVFIMSDLNIKILSPSDLTFSDYLATSAVFIVNIGIAALLAKLHTSYAKLKKEKNTLLYYTLGYTGLLIQGIIAILSSKWTQDYYPNHLTLFTQNISNWYTIHTLSLLLCISYAYLYTRSSEEKTKTTTTDTAKESEKEPTTAPPTSSPQEEETEI